MPAASFFLYRMAVMLLAPSTLITAWVLTAIGTSISRRTGTVLAVVFAAAFSIGTHIIRPVPTHARAGISTADIDAAVSYLENARLSPGTRIYASPNNHLALTFYTGLPVQSIAPVRKSFLDRYPYEVVLFEASETADVISDDAPVAPEALQSAASAAGVRLARTDAKNLSWNIGVKYAQEHLRYRVQRKEPAIPAIPEFAKASAVDYAHWRREMAKRISARLDRSPIFRGGEIMSPHDWWTWFFYRFSDPLGHRTHPIYADRLGNSTATFLRADWIVYRSPGASQAKGAVWK
jgi:hypothetical protein